MPSTITPTKLSTMSVYGKNCAAAEKLGLNVIAETSAGIVVETKCEGCAEIVSKEYYDPCNNPKHYMLLAIEHEISIVFDKEQGEVWCSWGANEDQETGWYLKNKTGEAVVNCFLMMDIKQNSKLN